MTAPNAYLRTKVLTASPAELRLMLLDGAIRFAEMARDGLAAKDPETAYNGTSRCQRIILELISSVSGEVAPDLCKKVSALYTYLYTQLMRASSTRDPDIVDEVLTLLHYERETWVLLIKELEESGEATTAPAPAPDLVGSRMSIEG
jgi:flagellar protein FliS